LTITEAPLDALTLAMFAVPSIALCGTNPPAWLRRHVFNRRVILATDNDPPGDRAADAMAGLFLPMGATVERIIPPNGVKDWNALLMERGAVGVAATLRHYELYDREHMSLFRGDDPFTGMDLETLDDQTRGSDTWSQMETNGKEWQTNAM